jgi:hypothetical protein
MVTSNGPLLALAVESSPAGSYFGFSAFVAVSQIIVSCVNDFLKKYMSIYRWP